MPNRSVKQQPVANLPVGDAVQVGRTRRGYDVVVAIDANARSQRRNVGRCVPSALEGQTASNRSPRNRRSVGRKELTRIARLAGVDVVDLGLKARKSVQHRLARATTIGNDLDLVRQIRGDHFAHVDRAARGQADDQRAVKVNVRVGDRDTVYTVLAVHTIAAISTLWPHRTRRAIPARTAVAAIGAVSPVFAVLDGGNTAFDLVAHFIVARLDV